MPRGDGRLSHDLDPLTPPTKVRRTPAASSVSGPPARTSPSSPTTASTPCSTAGRSPPGSRPPTAQRLLVYKDMGLVSQVFDERSLASLRGHLAVGHCRYSTTGGSTWENAAAHPRRPRRGTVAPRPQRQPHQLRGAADLVEDRRGDGAQRGELGPGNTDRHGARHRAARRRPRPHARGRGARGAATPARRLLLRLHGRAHPVCRARPPGDPPPRHSAGSSAAGSSPRETAALDIVGASFVREVEPGELVVIDEDGLRSHAVRRRRRRRAASSSTSTWPGPTRRSSGRVVHEARVEMGRPLAREHPVDADLVIADARVGDARRRSATRRSPASRTARVWSRTPTSGRTFIPPSPDASASSGIRLKLNPLEDVIRGKRLVVVDDSIVRGNTQRRSCGCCARRAAEVHVRISSPPVRWPCFYGIDFATRAELIATGLGVEEMRNSIGADSLGYISEDGMVAATDQPRERLCTACFTGTTRSSCPRRPDRQARPGDLHHGAGPATTRASTSCADS